MIRKDVNQIRIVKKWKASLVAYVQYYTGIGIMN